MRPSTLLRVLRKPEGLRKGTGASLRMAVRWPEGSGLTTVVNWADLAPVPWAALGEALVWVLKQELRLEICIGSHLAGAGRGQGGKNMISCSVFWIKTLWLQSQPGEQAWLNYAEVTGLTCSAAARRGQRHVKPEAETDGTFVALRPDPGFQGNPRFSALPT